MRTLLRCVLLAQGRSKTHPCAHAPHVDCRMACLVLAARKSPGCPCGHAPLIAVPHAWPVLWTRGCMPSCGAHWSPRWSPTSCTVWINTAVMCSWRTPWIALWMHRTDQCAGHGIMILPWWQCAIHDLMIVTLNPTVQERANHKVDHDSWLSHSSKGESTGESMC